MGGDVRPLSHHQHPWASRAPDIGAFNQSVMGGRTPRDATSGHNGHGQCSGKLAGRAPEIIDTTDRH